MPEEINPIAVGQSGQWHGKHDSQPVLPASMVTFPGEEGVAYRTTASRQDERDQQQAIPFSSSTTSANSSQPQSLPRSVSPITNAASVPTDSDGFVENPDAYQLWKPKPSADDVVTAQQFREKLAVMVGKLTMPKKQAEEVNKPSR